jgi:hypothetical protein
LQGNGVGLFNPPINFKRATPPGAYATYALALIDAKTLKPIRVQPATVDSRYPEPVPFRYDDERLWPKNPSAPTAAEISVLQQSLSVVLRDSVEETLLVMGLTDQEITDDLPTVRHAAIQ